MLPLARAYGASRACARADIRAQPCFCTRVIPPAAAAQQDADADAVTRYFARGAHGLSLLCFAMLPTCRVYYATLICARVAMIMRRLLKHDERCF